MFAKKRLKNKFLTVSHRFFLNVHVYILLLILIIFLTLAAIFFDRF